MAVVGPGSAETSRDQEASKSNTVGLSPCFLRHLRRLKRPAPAEAPLKGKLRMKSTSGAFVMLGVFVVLVGMTIAVIGYWPQRGYQVALSSPPMNSSRAGDVQPEAKSAPAVQSRSPPSTDRLKLIGPVIMGVGLFIFICANTMLYENRDQETRLLVQKNLYSMAVGLPCNSSVDLKYCQKKTDLSELQTRPEEGFYDIDLSSCVLQPCSSPRKKWVECCGAHGLQTTALLLHRNGVSPSCSLHSVYSNSSNSAEGNLYLPAMPGAAETTVSSPGKVVPLPVIKVNNCVIESPEVALLTVNGEPDNNKATDQSPGHSWNILPGLSLSAKGEGLNGSHVVIDVDDVILSKNEFLSPDCGRREFSSDMQLNSAGHSRSLDLGRRAFGLVATPQDRRNRSWPRLDHINLVGYTKLENTDDSVDKSLEQPAPSLSRGWRPHDVIGAMV